MFRKKLGAIVTMKLKTMVARCGSYSNGLYTILGQVNPESIGNRFEAPVMLYLHFVHFYNIFVRAVSNKYTYVHIDRFVSNALCLRMIHT